MLKRILIALLLVLVASGLAAAYIWWHTEPKPKGEAYIGAGEVPLWDGTGQVRRRLAKLSYGDKVAILGEYQDSVEVRTAKGAIGWVDQDGLIEPEVWNRLGELADQVRKMTPQAQGHTRVISNLRLVPGRAAPRIGQLSKDTPLEILSRSVADWQQGGAAGALRKEDWLLIRAKTPVMGQVGGWVLGRFVADDPPEPLPEYATSAAMNPVAWFPLRPVADSSGPKPNYLMAGTRGPEGQPCDFTMLRVYTWSVAHHRYETAFVDNDVCGKLPISVEFVPNVHQDVLFRFESLEPGGRETALFRMRDTIVREEPAADSSLPGGARRRR